MKVGISDDALKVELVVKDSNGQFTTVVMSPSYARLIAQLLITVADKIDGGEEEQDLNTCPNCGGPADNGHDRCVPPSPYWCTKCESDLRGDPN